MSLKSRACHAAGAHATRGPLPACSGCGCHCHPGVPAPTNFRDLVAAARERARERDNRPTDVQEDDPDA